jgi:type IV pilus assembly protein PilC
MYAKIYASFGAKLPAPTLALIWLSKHFTPIGIHKVALGPLPLFAPTIHLFNIGSFIMYVVIAALVFHRKTKDKLEIGRKLDRIKFRLPRMGALNHKQTLQRWAMTLSGALASGVPITRDIDWQRWLLVPAGTAGVAPNLAEAVRTGRSISSELPNYPDLYPPNVRTMMSTGEDTGETASMLESLAEALDSNIDAVVAGLSAKIEVMLLLVLGLVVGASWSSCTCPSSTWRLPFQRASRNEHGTRNDYESLRVRFPGYVPAVHDDLGGASITASRRDVHRGRCVSHVPPG